MKHTKLVPLVVVLVFSVTLFGCSFSKLVATDEYYDEEYEVTEEAYGEDSDADTTDNLASVVGENGAIARQHLEALTEIGPRWSGSAEEMQTGQYIMDAFDEMGLGAERQAFSASGDDGDMVDSSNIIAVKEGESSQVIVVGAHYDSSDEGLGTDDNASGVAVLLETAELVADQTTPYTIYFIAFGAEEAGLLGSYEFVDSLSDSEISDIILYVNMDSISIGDVTYAYSGSDSIALDWAVDWASSNDYDLEPIQNADLATDGEGTADYAAFDDAGIPWVYFEATNWDLGNEDGYTQVDPLYGNNGEIIHSEYDDLAYFDETFPGRVDQHMDLYISVLYAILTEYE